MAGVIRLMYTKGKTKTFPTCVVCYGREVCNGGSDYVLELHVCCWVLTIQMRKTNNRTHKLSAVFSRSLEKCVLLLNKHMVHINVTN